MSGTTVNPILDQYQAGVSAVTGGKKDRLATDKDTFLKLLVAQLTHQDPLNPVEDKEFVAQLAQFTSVEKLQDINTGIQTLNDSQAKQQVVNAVSLVGMEVSAEGDVITKIDDHVSILFAEFETAVSKATMNIYSTNSDGSIGKLVYSEVLGSYQAGTVKCEWPGKSSTGQNMPNGTYIMNVTAIKPDGENLLVKTRSNGQVIGIETSKDGNHYLYLEDGRTVRFNNIQFAAYPRKTDAGTGNPDTNTTTDKTEQKENGENTEQTETTEKNP